MSLLADGSANPRPLRCLPQGRLRQRTEISVQPTGNSGGRQKNATVTHQRMTCRIPCLNIISHKIAQLQKAPPQRLTCAACWYRHRTPSGTSLVAVWMGIMNWSGMRSRLPQIPGIIHVLHLHDSVSAGRRRHRYQPLCVYEPWQECLDAEVSPQTAVSVVPSGPSSPVR